MSLKDLWLKGILGDEDDDNDNENSSDSGKSRKSSGREVGRDEFDIDEDEFYPDKDEFEEREFGKTEKETKNIEGKRFVDLDPDEEEDEEEEEERIPIPKVEETKVHDTPVTQNANKILYIGIILDGTLSFTKIYAKVYSVLEQFLRELEGEKKFYREITIRYGLTILHDTPETVIFDDGSTFTDSESDVIKELNTLQFYGGSLDGREDLKSAIAKQLLELNMVPGAKDTQNCYKGILLFSDSLPKDDLTPDFTGRTFEAEGRNWPNYGLRFADFYTYSDEFVPGMRMVNRNGREVENERNMAKYHDIHDLVQQDAEWTSRFVEKMIREIVGQASMN